MGVKVAEFNRIIQGIADYDKEASPYAVAFARRVDFRTDPRQWRLQPKSTKESGSVITALPKWGERVGDTTYIYDEDGNLYSRSLAGSVSFLHQAPGSSGNGLRYFGENDFLYYTTDTVIGRYGYISGTPTWVDDFLGAEGGVPTNTYSLDLESGSSMYATAADSASLSITGDLTLEAYVRFESLPSAGSEMVIVGKWNENSDERSYKMVLAAISGFFGDGSDGALTISSNTTEAPIDSACTGTSGAYSLSATNASFASGQRVLIHQTKGTGAGTYQINTISGYTAGTITLQDALNADYVSGAQVRVLKQYTNVTINSGITYTAKAWDGTVGGILAFLASGTIAVNGTISADGKGFRGGDGTTSNLQAGYTGESPSNSYNNARGTSASDGGGGGGGAGNRGVAAAGGGGGGGYGSSGTVGEAGQSTGGLGGSTDGNADLTDMLFGAGGGQGGGLEFTTPGSGGDGGGILLLAGVTLTMGASSSLTCDGTNGADGATSAGQVYSGGGGGAGGSILLKAQTATLGTSLIGAAAGSGGLGNATPDNDGGAGGVGRIHLDYITSYTGTTTPTVDVTQDSNLGGNTVYHLRLYISSDGTTNEYYTKELTGLAVDTWMHLAAAVDVSASTAYLYKDATLVGTATGALTAIYNSTALLAVGADFNSSGTARSFLDGKIDDVRVWDDIRTATELGTYRQLELVGTESNLQGYWQLDNSASDTTANANNLTLVNSPTYSTSVPFAAPTTRRDIDQEDTSTGNTYALAAAVDEGAAHRQTFVPTKDPQKSISINVSDKGDTADWTLVVHDALNRTIASKTVTNANLNTGVFEFVFDSVWTPVIGASYHFHVYGTNTTGAPAVVAGTLNNLETAQFKSYYQFLVTDTDYHPIDQITNILTIGNGRYVATLDGSDTYQPHRLTFPSGFKVRCSANWREFIAFGCWRGSAIEDYDKGYIFFWDGFSDTYNFYIEVPEGGINAMVGSTGTLYISAGYKGDILEYTGGDKAVKVKRLPKIAVDKQLEILPGAMTMWQTLLRIGAGVTDSTDFEQGIYTYGRLNQSYPDMLTYDHYISTDTTQSTSVKIGLLLPVKKKLLVGWKDNVSYGLDSIDLSSDPVPSGSIEFPIRDQGSVPKEKMLDLIRADFEPLESGESIGLQYKIDRQSSWSTEETEADADEVELRYQLGGRNKPPRYREAQVRLNMYTSVSTSPKVIGVSALANELTSEKRI